MEKTRPLFYCLALLCICLYIPNTLLSQKSRLDSLSQVFQTSKNDSIRWQAARTLSEEWAFIQTDTAFAWAERSHEVAQETDHPNLIAQSLYLLGSAAYDKHDAPLAMENFLKALKQFKNLGDERKQMDTALEIGLVYQDMEEFEKARQHLDDFYQYYLNLGEAEAPSIIFALNQYVVFFEKTGDVDSMLHYAQATLQAAQRFQQTKYLSNIHNNLASVYLYAQNYDKAKYHFQEAERIGFGDNFIGRYYNFYALADMYYALEQPDSSIFFSQKALEVARSFGDIEKESDIQRFLSNLYKSQQDYLKAYQHLDSFLILSDSVMSMRYQEDISKLSIQYETQEKEAQIAQQELQIQLETNRRNIILFISSAGLLLLGGLILYMRNKQQVQARKAALELAYQQAEADRLRELDQLKSNFFANISHEFRTPLTLILGPLRAMRDGNFKEDQQLSFNQMAGQSERLLNLVNQMLDLSRLESGQMKSQRQWGELNQFVKTTVSLFESWADEKEIELITSLPERPLPVELDSDNLEKILSNLLSNALKFTPKGGKILVQLIPLSETDDQQTIRLSVQDNGPGIPKDQLSYIFNRFYQVEGSEGHVGSGIGLALTKELVNFYDGTIEVESSQGVGTCFTIILAFEKAKHSDIQPPKTIPNKAIHLAPKEQLTSPQKQTNSEAPLILIVEDNPDLRLYIRNQLKDQYLIIEAENGLQGLQEAKKHLPDLVLSDVRMPERDGLEFSAQLKTDEYTSHIPLIFLTALADQQNVRTGLSTGADAYLTKPFDPEELRIRVFNLIDQRKKLRQKFAHTLTEGHETPVVENPADAAFLEKVKTVVFDNLTHPSFSIELLGREVAMSRSQLHRKIKALTDHSPSVFVRTLRLQHAYKLLKQKQGNISEIAHEVGIPNLAQFSRSFKEQFGVPPSKV